jgi:uncharacterized protein (TIGR03083 family)
MSSPAVEPSDGERGLAAYDVADLAPLILTAWDDFLEVASASQLHLPTRVPGWTAHDLCVHLGSWPGSRSLVRVIEEARARDADGTFDQEGHSAAVIEANAAATDHEVLAGIERARAETAAFLDSPDVAELGRRPVRSAVGPLPLLTAVAAVTYELAVHALDLEPAGAPCPPAGLLEAGVASLVDVTGALAVRCGIDTTAGCVTPDGGWAFASRGPDWLTMRLPDARPGWPVVEADAAVILDASAGRRQVPRLLARREMRLHHVAGLLRLAPIVERVPGLPGGPALSGAARHLRGIGHWARLLPGLPH